MANSLKELADIIQDDFYKYCKENMDQVAESSQKQVPVDTGELKNSMDKVYKNNGDSATMIIEYKAAHATIVHFNLNNVVFKNGKSFYLNDPMNEMFETKLIKD